jgi:hypothetical protein
MACLGGKTIGQEQYSRDIICAKSRGALDRFRLLEKVREIFFRKVDILGELDGFSIGICLVNGRLVLPVEKMPSHPVAMVAGQIMILG